MMLNEVLQWAVLTVVALLALGAVRQSSLGRTDNRSAESGPKVGSRLPQDLQVELRRVNGQRRLAGTALAFVTEQCRMCQRLIAEASGREDVILVARTPTAGFLASLDQTGLPVVSDGDASLWRSLSISATPLVLRLDERGGIVSKGVTALSIGRRNKPGEDL